jgi:hypothetical protein
MKHVTYAEKSLLMGDDAADCLLEYARVLALATRADTVTVRAIGMDGNTVDAAFLLNETSNMIVESTNSEIDAPDNDEAVRYMQQGIDRLRNPKGAQAEHEDDLLRHGDLDLPGSP